MKKASLTGYLAAVIVCVCLSGFITSAFSAEPNPSQKSAKPSCLVFFLFMDDEQAGRLYSKELQNDPQKLRDYLWGCEDYLEGRTTDYQNCVQPIQMDPYENRYASTVGISTTNIIMAFFAAPYPKPDNLNENVELLSVGETLLRRVDLKKDENVYPVKIEKQDAAPFLHINLSDYPGLRSDNNPGDNIELFVAYGIDRDRFVYISSGTGRRYFRITYDSKPYSSIVKENPLGIWFPLAMFSVNPFQSGGINVQTAPVTVAFGRKWYKDFLGIGMKESSYWGTSLTILNLTTTQNDTGVSVQKATPAFLLDLNDYVYFGVGADIDFTASGGGNLSSSNIRFVVGLGPVLMDIFNKQAAAGK